MESWLKATWVLLIGALLAGCGAPASVATPDAVTVQLSWLHNVEFAGFYVAQQLGYYSDVNLDVTLLPGGPSVDAATEVIAGDAQFGIVSADQVIYQRYLGHNLVAVASIFQRNPLMIMAMEDSGILRPHDLAGKTVGVISADMDTTWDLQFLALLDHINVNPSDMTFLPIEDYYGANSLLYYDMQAVSGFFSTNELVQANMDGINVVRMYYSDYGGVTYVNPLFTTEQLIEQNPDLVDRFVKATMRGYQYAVAYPEEAAKISLQYYTDLENVSLQVVTEMMYAQVPFIDSGDAQIGWLDSLVWEYTQETLVEQGIIMPVTNLGTPYTNEFLPED
ncbi:MAG: ABC transporter substrate-binding protein [Anaerolineae bacterium]|nr:ABC transporter substrate-binding protein [Anaerolineae bacterium]